MGGAERAARRRRQADRAQGAGRGATAGAGKGPGGGRGQGGGKRTAQGAGKGAGNGAARGRADVGGPGAGRDRRVRVGVVLGIVLVVLFGGAFLLLNRPWDTRTPAATGYPVAVDGVVAVAGRADAPVTIDVYEDYLCPACERFQNRWGDEIATALVDGRLQVNYHALNILEGASDPPGYSTLAANAALCAVPAGIWPAYHQRLFAEQPAEGGPGLTAEQLTTFGTELGAGPEFGTCVAANARAAAITAAADAAASNPALQTDGRFGTPTVAVGGRKIDVSDSDWLERVLATP